MSDRSDMSISESVPSDRSEPSEPRGEYELRDSEEEYEDEEEDERELHESELEALDSKEEEKEEKDDSSGHGSAGPAMTPAEYERAVMEVVREYLVVVFGRLARHGNYGGEEEAFTLYERVDIPELFISMCTHVMPDGGLVRYFVRLSIRTPSGRTIVIRDLEIWNHAFDSEEAEFEPSPIELVDNLSFFRRSVLRWSRYLPYRECANRECSTLLLPCESPYCFECKHGIAPCDCSICLDDRTPKRVVTTSCGHTFHRSCFRRILPFESGKVKCPLCRTVVPKDN